MLSRLFDKRSRAAALALIVSFAAPASTARAADVYTDSTSSKANPELTERERWAALTEGVGRVMRVA